MVGHDEGTSETSSILTCSIDPSSLLELFSLGEKTGKKISPEDAHKAMRIKKDPTTGIKEFQPKSYLSVEQIKSLFARFSTLYRQNKLELLNISQDNGLMDVEEHHEYTLTQQQQESDEFLVNALETISEDYDKWSDDDSETDQ